MRMGLLWWAWLCGIVGAAGENVLSYNVRGWQTDDGLPQNSVFAITQTRDGYLWVGTHAGLARFDGERFTVMDETIAPGLARAWITALCTTRDGALWVGTDAEGLTRLGEGKAEHYGAAEGLVSNQVRCLYEATDGALWIGTEGGVSRFQDGSFTSITDQQGLGDNSVRGFCEDARRTIQVATRRGLSRISQDGRVANLVLGTNWNANAARCVYADRQGRLWIGATEGLTCLDGERRVFLSAVEGLPDNIVNALFQDQAGQLWVGTYGGLTRVVGEAVVGKVDNEAALGDLVYTIFEDREQNLWIGARDGLFRLNPARFKTYTRRQGLTHNNVMSVYEDPAGTVWVGIWGGGLNAVAADHVTAYVTPAGLARDAVLALHPRREGGLWIGMDFDGGLNQWVDGQRTGVRLPGGMLTAPIRVIHEDRDGALWLGTSHGLNVVRAGQCETFTPANGLGGDTVLAICEDTEGAIWVGTDGGLSRFKGREVTKYTTADGLTHNTVGALYEDEQQTLWIGTRGGGLSWRSGGKFYHCTTQQGLFSDEIYEILEDDFGFLWMSCRQGIFRVARRQLEQLGRGTLTRVTCTAFGKADGLVSVQCNGVAKPSGWKGREGRLWFPTIRGVVAVQSRIKTNHRPPPVVIETVLADKYKVQIPEVKADEAEDEGSGSASVPLPGFGGRTLVIPPGRGELDIRYTALSLQAPEKVRFRRRLEGVDSDWTEAGTERAAHYQNLAPGRYRFQVIACNNDGVWNEAGATLALVLRPHYWQTWWFKVALAALGGLALTAVYRARVARVRELEHLRIQIAANLHDDVGARLTKVAMITEVVERQTAGSDPIHPHVESIARTTREIIQAMDEIVWTINPKNDTLENLANYIFQYAQEYFQDTGVRCRLDFPAQFPELPVSTETRHNLFMAFKEALNNILKHAAATEVRIRLGVADQRLTLEVEDNGCGFSPGRERRGGNGLGNMKQRLEQVGGKLTLESSPGAGTRLNFEAPAR